MKDNSTGKEKDFFSKGKQAFDSIKVIHIDGKKAPQRPWVGLTDDEIRALASWWPSYDQMPALMVLAKDIQNSLKEKNT